jgi:hypothetical protein
MKRNLWIPCYYWTSFISLVIHIAKTNKQRKRKHKSGWVQWLKPAISATQEDMVGGQPGQKVSKILSQLLRWW